MNGDAYLSADDPPAARDLDRFRDFIEQHPAEAVAAAACAGILVRLLPRRFVAEFVGRTVTRALPAALLTLGVIKAAEILGSLKSQE